MDTLTDKLKMARWNEANATDAERRNFWQREIYRLENEIIMEDLKNRNRK